MRLLSILSLLLPLLIPSTLSASLTLVPPPSLLPSLTSSTTAHLRTLGLHHSAPISRTGTFHFRNLTAGSYLLDVAAADFVFEVLRVDVTDGERDEEIKVYATRRGIEWENRGVERRERPVQVLVLGRKEYYSKREGFSPMSFLKNPMILIAILGMAVMFGMPYLIENMDPETRAEFDAQSKAGGPLGLSGLLPGSSSSNADSSGAGSGTAADGNPANAIRDFDMAAWMAGSGGAKKTKDGEGNGSGSGSGNGRSGGEKKGGGGRRRG
ncbi:MAG: hypothetical protein M1817_004708 [Caeruleum heppii]|nr:MAG: hypothetical protein M1817_004708 [Caeruleum heppii]